MTYTSPWPFIYKHGSMFVFYKHGDEQRVKIVGVDMSVDELVQRLTEWATAPLDKKKPK